MKKIAVAMAPLAFLAAVAAIISIAPAQAGGQSSICDGGFYYSVEQPDWSMRGIPCWKPWAQNPILKYRASHASR